MVIMDIYDSVAMDKKKTTKNTFIKIVGREFFKFSPHKKCLEKKSHCY